MGWNLLVVAQDVTWGGDTGDSVHLREIVSHLARRGHLVHLVARGGGRGAPTPAGLTVHLLSTRWNLAFGFVRRPLLLWRLFRLAVGWRATLMYSRGFGDPWEAIAAKCLGLPLVFEVNGYALEEADTQRKRPRAVALRRLDTRVVRWGFGRADAVVTVTEALRRLLVERLGVPPERIRVIPNAVDLDLFRPGDRAESRSQLDLPPGGPVVVFVGNLARWQGVEVLVRAFDRVVREWPQSLLLVVGDGPERTRIQHAAESAGVGPRVRFVGAVPHDRVGTYITCADVCVAPMTRAREHVGSSAMKVHEYLAAGKPVVASDVPGHEFLERAGLGRLVPPEDVQVLGQALVDAIRDERWRAEVAERAREFAVSRGSWASVASRIEALCKEVLER